MFEIVFEIVFKWLNGTSIADEAGSIVDVVTLRSLKSDFCGGQSSFIAS